MGAPFGMAHGAWVRSVEEEIEALEASPATTEGGQEVRCVGCGEVFRAGEEFALLRFANGWAVHVLCYCFGGFTEEAL